MLPYILCPTKPLADVRAYMNTLEVGVNSHAILQMVWRAILLSTTPKRSILIVVCERQAVGDVGALTTTSQKTDSVTSAIGFFMAS